MNRHLTPHEIDALLLETATGSDRCDWEEHLKGCASCRSALESQGALFDAVRKGVAVPPAPVALDERISAGISRSRTEEQAGVAGLPPAVPWHRGWAWTAALVALAFGAGFWLGRSPVGEGKATGGTRAQVLEPAPSDSGLFPKGQSARATRATRGVTPTASGRILTDLPTATGGSMSSEDGSTQMTLSRRRAIALPTHQRDEDTQSTLGGGWDRPS